MTILTPAELDQFRGNHVKLSVADRDLDLEKAMAAAKDRARGIADDPMLLLWYCGKTGEYYAKTECSRSGKPVWIVFAESRGADLAVNLNDGEYIGFGPGGQRVADVLLENGLSAGVIELNPRTTAVARQKGLPVHMADATSSDIISHIGIKGACLVIVTVPDPRAAREIIRNVRLFSPESMIIARSRYHIASETLKNAGAAVVVDEENTIGDELAREVMDSMRRVNRNALACALAGERPFDDDTRIRNAWDAAGCDQPLRIVINPRRDMASRIEQGGFRSCTGGDLRDRRSDPLGRDNVYFHAGV